MKTFKAELYYQAETILGEGPVWDAGVLTWVDITGKAIFQKPDDTAQARRHDVGVEVGAVAPWKDNRLVLATECGFQSYDLSTGEGVPWANPEAALPRNRFNDGKCDPRGRFVAGTYNRDGKPQAALYSLGLDRGARRIFGPVTCSNGLAWSEDGKTLYYIDTASRAVRSFAYNLETGDLGGERVVIEIPKSHGLPDGMTIDRDGNLWVALWDGWGIECWSPSTGRQLARIDVPAARTSCCVFGGPDYATLFITTARSGLPDAELAKQELAGSIFRAQPGPVGRAPFHFGG